jgi:hypothetical protein
MTLRVARFSIVVAALALALPAAAADSPQTSGRGPDCAAATSPRDPLNNPEARRGTMDEQFCTQIDRLPDGRTLELYGGTVDGGQRRGAEPLQGLTRDELDHQDGFVGFRLRLRY